VVRLDILFVIEVREEKKVERQSGLGAHVTDYRSHDNLQYYIQVHVLNNRH
jgi:hypothetical protein